MEVGGVRERAGTEGTLSRRLLIADADRFLEQRCGFVETPLGAVVIRKTRQRRHEAKMTVSAHAAQDREPDSPRKPLLRRLSGQFEIGRSIA